MKTSITLDQLDDDVLAALREQAELLDLPLQQVFSDALRRGLDPVGRSKRPAHRVNPLQGKFRPEIDQLKFNQLNEEDLTEESSKRQSA